MDEKSKITISSFNCRGLRDKKKRADVFDFLKQARRSEIYCLQDVHWEEGIIDQIKHEWGNECFICSGSSNSRGVAILFNDNLTFKVEEIVRDPDGNFIALSMIVNSYHISLITVCGPNTDCPSFYDGICELIISIIPIV